MNRNMFSIGPGKIYMSTGMELSNKFHLPSRSNEQFIRSDNQMYYNKIDLLYERCPDYYSMLTIPQRTYSESHCIRKNIKSIKYKSKMIRGITKRC